VYIHKYNSKLCLQVGVQVLCHNQQKILGDRFKSESDPLFTFLITFLAIMYALTFSLPVTTLLKIVEHYELRLYEAAFIIIWFVLFLLFDWLLISIALRHQAFIHWHSYVFTVPAVPFIGISLHFTLLGYLSKCEAQTIIGLQSFFVFLVLVCAYDIIELFLLLRQKKIKFQLGVIISLKVLLLLVLLPSTFLAFVYKTEYLLNLAVWLYIVYFISKLIIDFVTILKSKTLF